MWRNFRKLMDAPMNIGKRAVNLDGLIAINLRKDCDSKVFWTLTLSFRDGRVEIFDSVSHASEEELRQAFDSLAEVCKNQT
jgi:hypothetical protein